MTVTLATLTERLQADVPARSGVPTEAQYERLVKDAVADYSRRKPMEKVTTLTIVSGTADYTLPDDFLFAIKLESLWHPDGVIHSTSGLIPVSATYDETYTVAGLTMTFHPTPRYNTTRDLRYAAAHVLNDSDAYASMTEADARIVLLKAAELALTLQARAAAISGEMVEYQIGDERVKRASAADSLTKRADFARSDYEAAVAAVIGPVGVRAAYDSLGQ
jgi:hypothetical protein